MLNKLEIHERFKDARIVYNKNGKQTMEEVANATGIQKSMISSLEKDDTRGASFRDVAKLANHYGVSMDWLCGLTDVKSPKADIKSINKLTGLDESAINTLIETKKLSEATVSLPSACANNLLMFYSHLISDIAITGAIIGGVDKLISFANNRELTESEDEVFDNRDEAVSFYQYKIQETLKNFIIRFSQSTKLENGD